ncbi:hypothetical protein [Alcanivorax sp.]|uniref:hypothetical protein n=1 Tax=Alcanivorax sp. TaxID=1872427 RepID=UPI000C66E569|nr:hypothetical protein [Alcanivorax sp.]MBU85405.1 hypothetical protein [Alcanivorax sp.]|tara:strand:- start:48 stop:317 length:270 start_codon:yes stop_codon:yes gene_type:complete
MSVPISRAEIEGESLIDSATALRTISELIQENGIRESCEGMQPFLDLGAYEGLACAMSIIAEKLQEQGEFFKQDAIVAVRVPLQEVSHG